MRLKSYNFTLTELATIVLALAMHTPRKMQKKKDPVK